MVSGSLHVNKIYIITLPPGRFLGQTLPSNLTTRPNAAAAYHERIPVNLNPGEYERVVNRRVEGTAGRREAIIDEGGWA